MRTFNNSLRSSILINALWWMYKYLKCFSGKQQNAFSTTERRWLGSRYGGRSKFGFTSGETKLEIGRRDQKKVVNIERMCESFTHFQVIAIFINKKGFVAGGTTGKSCFAS